MVITEVPGGAPTNHKSETVGVPAPAVRRFTSWSLVIWMGFLLGIAVFAVTGSDLAPYDPATQQVLARLLPPLSSSIVPAWRSALLWACWPVITAVRWIDSSCA